MFGLGFAVWGSGLGAGSAVFGGNLELRTRGSRGVSGFVIIGAGIIRVQSGAESFEIIGVLFFLFGLVRACSRATWFLVCAKC